MTTNSTKPVIMQILPALENGGVERGTIDIAKALQKDDFEPIVVSNGGVFKHTSESSVTVDKDEIDFLIEKYRDLAQFYTNNFTNFMVYNQTTYPEYNANTEDDFYPDTSISDFSGWVL
jgi:hypothetical protein